MVTGGTAQWGGVKAFTVCRMCCMLLILIETQHFNQTMCETMILCLLAWKHYISLCFRWAQQNSQPAGLPGLKPSPARLCQTKPNVGRHLHLKSIGVFALRRRMNREQRSWRKREEGKKLQEKMKEEELEKKSKRAQRNKSTELHPPGSTEKVQREGKGRNSKAHQHKLTHECKLELFPFIFSAFYITWHFHTVAAKWLKWF